MNYPEGANTNYQSGKTTASGKSDVRRITFENRLSQKRGNAPM